MLRVKISICWAINNLVAPMVTVGNSRMVKLLKGQWKDDLGKIHQGGRTIEIVVPLERLPYFEKLK
ncbi:MAG: hypothetical protein LUD15_12470 [Bacteroides sp.]|nr:hypothetical protein [Bacteroides sp.]